MKIFLYFDTNLSQSSKIYCAGVGRKFHLWGSVFWTVSSSTRQSSRYEHRLVNQAIAKARENAQKLPWLAEEVQWQNSKDCLSSIFVLTRLSSYTINIYAIKSAPMLTEPCSVFLLSMYKACKRTLVVSVFSSLGMLAVLHFKTVHTEVLPWTGLHWAKFSLRVYQNMFQ